MRKKETVNEDESILEHHFSMHKEYDFFSFQFRLFVRFGLVFSFLSFRFFLLSQFVGDQELFKVYHHHHHHHHENINIISNSISGYSTHVSICE